MRRSLLLLSLISFTSSFSVAQSEKEEDLVSVLGHKWERIRIAGQKVENFSVPPVRSVTNENKIRQRTARETQPRGSFDPNDLTVDGRSAALERSVQDSRTLKTDDINAFRYAADIKNNSNRKIEIIFWEIGFKEFANPQNFVRHQFLCSVKIKPGENFELSAHSILAPSEVVSNTSLTGNGGKQFEENVFINRLEFSDGAILQRRGWKLEEVKKGVEKITSAPWGREICKPI